MRARPEDPIAQLTLQSRHERERDDERHDANRDADRGDQRDERDERLLALGEQIAEGDEEFERHVDTELYQEPLTVELRFAHSRSRNDLCDVEKEHRSARQS
jgi:hypothetical protein